MDTKKIYKQTEEHRRKISEANKGRVGEIDADTEKMRRKKISQTMKRMFKENPENFKSITEASVIRKSKLGYINSPEARAKVSKSISEMWKEGRATDKQKQTLFRAGEDDRRVNTQFKEGHEVPQEWRDAVKENRKTQVFPKVDTSIEIKIQKFLKELKIEFFAHQYMDIEHGYQCDILIPSKKTVIECFGTYWHKYPYGTEVDSLRCQELRAKGWRVLVFWENEIKAMTLDDFNPHMEKTWIS
jgi:G:T-mismatch repair DNA endonuclease (very short patch repair protein)